MRRLHHEYGGKAMSSMGPLITLNNGVEMPAFGLGVYQSSPEQTVAAVEVAVANGGLPHDWRARG